MFLFSMILTAVTILKPLPKEPVCYRLTNKQMEKAIKILYPEVKEKTITLVTETINTWSPVFKIKDKCLILSLIKKESTFRHIKGAKGEWGMLQAIPWEPHTQRIALRYKCHKEDKLCKCPPDSKCSYYNRKGYHRWIPDIGYTKDGEYRVSGFKLKNFMEKNPRAALAIGIGELGFWKEQYERKYKNHFWKTFPKYHASKKIKNTQYKISYIEGWWERMNRGLGDKIWIVHHNYGGQLKLTPTGLWYPIKFHQFYSKIVSTL